MIKQNFLQENTFTPRYIYTFKYDYHHEQLCKLESRQIFDKEESNKLLFSNIKADPSMSPFIKNRIDIISSSSDYVEFLNFIKAKQICIEGFKIEYLSLSDDIVGNEERHQRLKDIGHRIKGEPNLKAPSVTYSVCRFEDIWYFGVLEKNRADWHKHKHKPCSFSNSICMIIGKTLVSMAAKGEKSNRLIDSCCGVGTVLLEACYAGFDITGYDINYKACKNARTNLVHYNYSADVFKSDIKNVLSKFDGAIIDLPYNLYSHSDEAVTFNIISSTSKLTNRMVIVSISDIESSITQCGLKVIDYCTVEKRGKSTFERKIWICEKPT